MVELVISVSQRLRKQLDALYDEGRAISQHFEETVRQHRFHPFVASDYNVVEACLVEIGRPGLRFLEWGSGSGVITVMASLLGFDAYGIELDSDLVSISRRLAAKYETGAQFSAGSFLPGDYLWKSSEGDKRLGTIGHGTSGYPRLQRGLDEFDLVFGYSWSGEEPVMQDLMEKRGAKGARLLMFRGTWVEIWQDGELLNGPPEKE